MSDIQIKIRNLCKVYSSPIGSVNAINNVSLDIHKGDIYGIIGMSGAGKSTLIRCINALDVPSSGEIYLDDVNIHTMNQNELRKARKRMAMIFQSFNLLMQSTVHKNIRYPMDISGVPKDKANKRVAELLKIVGLESKANVYPSQLSGGQRQRVAIARALASDPEVLLCDEATSALDPMTTQSILDLLKDINKRLGITIVIITHEMAVIRQICNKVAILDNGNLVEQGSVDSVFMNTKSNAGRRLFGIINDENNHPINKPYYRIVFDGEKSTNEPIISRLSREIGIDVNILAADMKYLNEKTYGQLMIEKAEDPIKQKKIFDYLEKINIKIEEVNP